MNGVFCKENHSNTLCTSRVHGPYTARVRIHGRQHGPYAAVYPAVQDGCYTAVHGCLHVRVHGPYSRLHCPYVYMARARPCTRPCNGSRYLLEVYLPLMIHSGRGQLTTHMPSSGQQQRVLFLRSWATCLLSTHSDVTLERSAAGSG